MSCHATSEPRDVLIAVSTTDKSPNIIRAVEVANSIGLTVAVLAPEDGGGLVKVCECISVPTSEIARTQECHILLGHIMCGTVEGMVLRERTPRHQERRRPPV